MIKAIDVEREKILIPTRELLNRESKRKFNQDCMALLPDLVAVEIRFAEDLFDTHDFVSYRDLYRYYLDQFTTTCQMVLRSKKKHLRYAMLNFEYFARTYGPVEGRDDS